MFGTHICSIYSQQGHWLELFWSRIFLLSCWSRRLEEGTIYLLYCTVFGWPTRFYVNVPGCPYQQQVSRVISRRVTEVAMSICHEHHFTLKWLHWIQYWTDIERRPPKLILVRDGLVDEPLHAGRGHIGDGNVRRNQCVDVIWIWFCFHSGRAFRAMPVLNPYLQPSTSWVR